jgi:hypothetical protein
LGSVRILTPSLMKPKRSGPRKSMPGSEVLNGMYGWCRAVVL